MSLSSYKSVALLFFVLAMGTSTGLQSTVREDPALDKSERPRILVTNDDGIESAGLLQLVKTLAEHADVVVCAPNENRSGASQSVPSLNRPMTVKDVELAGASHAVAVGGSPADAVCYAVVVLGKDDPFDFVVSGINSSANVGDQSHSSGTVGAAMEGVYRGIPSIAVSQGGRSRDYSFSAGFAARFIDKLRSHAPEPGVVYSINVPSANVEDLKGVAVRPMGGTQIAVTGYRSREGDDGLRIVRTELHFETTGPEGSDAAAFFEGFVTVTPLRFDWTDREAVKDLEGWGLTTR